MRRELRDGVGFRLDLAVDSVVTVDNNAEKIQEALDEKERELSEEFENIVWEKIASDQRGINIPPPQTEYDSKGFG